MAAAPSLIAWRALFAGLGCFMLATLLYTIITDGSPFRREILTPDGFSKTLEPLFTFTVSHAYTSLAIFYLFIGKLSNSLRKLRHGNWKDGECKVKCSYVVLGRMVFSFLGIMMTVIILYTLLTDGWPFRKELLTPLHFLVTCDSVLLGIKSWIHILLSSLTAIPTELF
ncbi:hypothetical protein AXF42_Ash005567 [Apostasia shenzhenica]|uniref:Uncharacterized protein n=1 Tax=Apostasia shenzhenica TaxID=1088818 RepID=A0A2I0B7B1_9ASPA|nr:hypothetical protein AXF42_Ash005567 [Apostasia shenzhenica]